MHIRPRLLLAAALALALAGAAPASGQQLGDPTLLVESLDTGATSATGIRFLSSDEFFVIEKNSGRVLHNAAGVVSEVLDLPVNFVSERGLIGIELHPGFDTNGFVYLYFSLSEASGDSGVEDQWVANVLSRFTWNGSALVNEVPLLSIPRRVGGENGPNHDGGPMRFGPDGKLYLATGDLNRRDTEQNLTAGGAFVPAFSGGIHRLNDDGSVPADNPFNVPALDAAFHGLFAYGVRNSFGLAFDPVTGALWDTENGPTSMDEINRVQAGFNSGWVQLMGPDARDPQSTADLVDLLPGVSAYSDPELSFATPIGITALGFLAGSKLGPAFDDRVWFGSVNTTSLFEARLNPARDGFELAGGLADLVVDGAEIATLVAGTGFAIPTDIQLDPDGHPTVLGLNGYLHRVLLDSDLDGVADVVDNCSDVANPGQQDVDGGQDDDASLPGVQHYGDACDADLDNDGVVGASDFFAVFRPCLGADLTAAPQCLRADLDGDGTVASSDFFARLRPAFGTPPGPGTTDP